MRCPGCSQLLAADVSICPACGSLITGDLSSGNISAPIPPQPRRSSVWKTRRGSAWKSVLIPLVATILVVGGLRIVLYEINSHIAAANQAENQARLNNAAMQLYHQVLNRPPISQDSLTAPSNTWQHFDEKNDVCVIKSDGMHVRNSITGSFISCIDKATSFTDFAFQVDMRILSGGGGLTWRENSFGLYEFLIAPDGSYTVGMQKVAQTVGFLSGKTIAMIDKNGATNLLTVMAKKNDMYLYINQTFVTLLQDSNFSFGNVGVIANTDKSPAEAVYTNAKLWDLSA
jgi:hypothetical protein